MIPKCICLCLKIFIFKMENISMILNSTAAPVFQKGRKDSPICKKERTFLHFHKVRKSAILLTSSVEFMI